MSIDIFYKVRAIREDNNRISVSEKGLLRHLRSPNSRNLLRKYAEEYLHKHPNEGSIVATYVWDFIDGRQIAYFNKLTV